MSLCMYTSQVHHTAYACIPHMQCIYTTHYIHITMHVYHTCSTYIPHRYATHTCVYIPHCTSHMHMCVYHICIPHHTHIYFSVHHIHTCIQITHVHHTAHAYIPQCTPHMHMHVPHTLHTCNHICQSTYACTPHVYIMHLHACIPHVSTHPHPTCTYNIYRTLLLYPHINSQI